MIAQWLGVSVAEAELMPEIWRNRAMSALEAETKAEQYRQLRQRNGNWRAR
jgi:hypothetical protein